MAGVLTQVQMKWWNSTRLMYDFLSVLHSNMYLYDLHVYHVHVPV